MKVFFSEVFGVDRKTIEEFGAFDVSLFADLPLFIDPFLLFNSTKPEYKKLHNSIIKYLSFLRDKSIEGEVTDGELRYWYCFPEVKQNWFGFTKFGNGGHGLGIEFARSLHSNLNAIFQNFGKETVTRGSHLEKVCLIKEGIGRDNISDFATNLIKRQLYVFTEQFALKHLDKEQCQKVSINNIKFNYRTETWQSETFLLPWYDHDHVVLTPQDMLTRDETWINRGDLYSQFQAIPRAIPDDQLRGQIDNYFRKSLAAKPGKSPTKEELISAVDRTIEQYPILIDYFIRMKEDNGGKAAKVSAEKRKFAEFLFAQKSGELAGILQKTDFFAKSKNTFTESLNRAAFLKDVIENQGGHKAFYGPKGVLTTKEEDLQIMFRLVWFGTTLTVTREANDGRGPADFKISRGSKDHTVIEFKLASNSQLKRNLQKQVPIYKAASNAKHGISIIIFFTTAEEKRLAKILKELGMDDEKRVITIDARRDNKPSGSKA